MAWNNKQKVTLAIAWMTSFIGPFAASSVQIALPQMQTFFGLDMVASSWIITAYLLSTAILLLPAGNFVDAYGKVKMYKRGILLFGLISLSCAFVTSGYLLIGLRFFQGLSAAFIQTTGMALLISIFEPKERGKILGINVSAVYVGLSAGPFLGGYLVQTLGWQSLFWLVGPLQIMAFVLIHYFYPKRTEELKHGGNFDWKGTLIYAFLLGGFVYGAGKLTTHVGQLMILMSALMLVLFIWHEKRVQNPLIDFNLYLKNRIFGYSNIAALINYSSTFSLIFLMSFYLQRVRLLSPYEAGTIMVIQPVFMALCSPLTGRLSDKFEARYLSTIGMSIAALGLLSLSWISAETPYWLLMTIFAFLGVGFALFSSPNMNTIMSSVERTQLGIASGSAATMRVVGQMVSMSISTLVIALFFAHSDGLNISSAHFMEAMKIILYIGTLLSLVGIYFSFSRGKLRK